MREPRFHVDNKGRIQADMRPEGMTAYICDFCSAQPTIKTYQAKDAQVFPGITSLGQWEACEACAKMIDANDRQGLLDRAMIQYAEQGSHLEIIRFVHNKFFENRTV